MESNTQAIMESSTQTYALAALAGLFCLLAVALLGGLAFYSMRRARPAPPPRQAPAPPSVGQSRLSGLASGPARPPGSALPGGADAGYDEEEMPTVVMHQREPAPQAPKAPAAPPQSEGFASRTRGATIIAFDDEDDDG